MADKKGEAKKKISPKKGSYYDNGKSTKRTCPKCSSGVFMAEHKDRYHCGKCSYTEFKK